jgi:hypothetical protein
MFECVCLSSVINLLTSHINTITHSFIPSSFIAEERDDPDYDAISLRCYHLWSEAVVLLTTLLISMMPRLEGPWPWYYPSHTLVLVVASDQVGVAPAEEEIGDAVAVVTTTCTLSIHNTSAHLCSLATITSCPPNTVRVNCSCPSYSAQQAHHHHPSDRTLILKPLFQLSTLFLLMGFDVLQRFRLEVSESPLPSPSPPSHTLAKKAPACTTGSDCLRPEAQGRPGMSNRTGAMWELRGLASEFRTTRGQGIYGGTGGLSLQLGLPIKKY